MYASASAQDQNNRARKFDEFGDIQSSHLIARLDNFAAELGSDPAAKGFVVVYRGRRDLKGLSNAYAIRSKAYLVNSRRLPRERVVTVDGGEANCLTQELWIVPAGTAPIPRNDAYPRHFADLDSARKIDEFSYDLSLNRRRRVLTEYPTEADYLETFANQLRAEKHSMAYIIAYAHFSRRRQLVGDSDYVYYERRIDPDGTARRRLRFEKNILVKAYGIEPSRIRLIDGGYRTWRSVEFWIVSRGAHAPIPTPNSFPPQRNGNRK